MADVRNSHTCSPILSLRSIPPPFHPQPLCLCLCLMWPVPMLPKSQTTNQPAFSPSQLRPPSRHCPCPAPATASASARHTMLLLELRADNSKTLAALLTLWMTSVIYYVSASSWPPVESWECIWLQEQLPENCPVTGWQGIGYCIYLLFITILYTVHNMLSINSYIVAKHLTYVYWQYVINDVHSKLNCKQFLMPFILKISFNKNGVVNFIWYTKLEHHFNLHNMIKIYSQWRDQ